MVDRLTLRQPRNKLLGPVGAVRGHHVHLPGAPSPAPRPVRAQFKLILLGGFFMTCTVGVVSGVAIEVIHPGVRSTGSAVLSLFQNLFGLAVGPFLVGVLSDVWGPAAGRMAAVLLLRPAGGGGLRLVRTQL